MSSVSPFGVGVGLEVIHQLWNYGSLVAIRAPCPASAETRLLTLHFLLLCFCAPPQVNPGILPESNSKIEHAKQLFAQ